MSRLTNSPFNKPSPFQFPRVPLSPPETSTEQFPSSSLSASISVAGGIDGLPHVEPDLSRSQGSETPGSRFRRGVSSLAYHNSGLRDARERGVSRNYRYFVIVVPPPAFVHDHGQLGHTLSLGPQNRLSQGLLMPLFPTMYAQLSAIAREFNFPSTTGLCLYLHFTDNGITSTPRISDESWQLVWSHVFEASSPSSKIPIVGKIEFDVDFRQARWYGAWLSSSHREQLDVPSSVVPSTAPSLSHFRMDSRATEVDLTVGDDPFEHHPPTHESVPTIRHIPKKLSLVDRLDSVSTRSGPSRPPARAPALASPPDQVPSSSVLSPIFQEEEPKTATLSLKGDLQSKVNIWRASASLNPSSLAARGQTSLEPANLPNTISLDAVMRTDEEDDGELNLEDFAWSVSSVGPLDYDESESVLSWDRVLSVHMDRRAEGSVCLTPSDCTSFGPSDYTLPPLSPPSERAFTPDLGGRMYEDAPLTPATATSWGPPSDLEWPPSPLSEGGISSVDLTYRMQLSRPSTPATATSWGAPSEWPASPVSDGRASSVDFTYRMQLSRPQTPSTATSWGPSSWPASPATPYYVHTPDAAHRSFDLDMEEPLGAPWRQVWPYTQERTSAASSPWSHVWPYTQERRSAMSSPWRHVWPYTEEETSGSEPRSSPWNQVWPYNRVATAAASRSSNYDGLSVYMKCSYPSLVIYQHVYPYFNLYPPIAQASHHVQSVYPHFYLYPPVTNTRQSVIAQVSERRNGSSQYPVFNLYPAVYPWNLNEIYSVSRPRSFPKSFTRSPGYPDFEIYPVIEGFKRSASRPWNHVWPYQATKKEDSSRVTRTPTSRPWNHVWPYTEKSASSVSVYLSCSYPSLQIYRPVYPCFDLYPALPSRKPTEVHYPHFNLYPAIFGFKGISRQRPVTLESVAMSFSYPVFNLYKAVYPYNLEEVYPILKLSVNPTSKKVFRSDSHGYPHFEIYPAVKSRGYPDFDIYPAHTEKRGLDRRTVGMKLQMKYPYFDLYPTVYPHIVLYPPGNIVISRKPRTNFSGPKSSEYPDFDIYPAVKSNATGQPRSIGYPDFVLYPPVSSKSSGYPDFCIYPPITSRPASAFKSRMAMESSSSGYPDFVIYPPMKFVGYPDFCIYPPIISRNLSASKSSTVKKTGSNGYPDFVIYPPMKSAGYPDFCIYPPITSRNAGESKSSMVKKSSSSGYPDFVIYPPMKSIGYPDFCIYPPVSRNTSKSKSNMVKKSGSSGYPDFVIYPPMKLFGYPDFCLYPPSSRRKNIEESKIGINMRVSPAYPFFNLYPGVYPTITLYPSRSGELEQKGRQIEIFVKHGSRYPVFDLYPAVYPHIVPYAKVICLSAVTPNRPRLTHAELHALVWASGFPKTHKTHKVLHEEVFANGFFETPSGKTSSGQLQNIRVDTVLRSRARSSSIARRPPSMAPPLRGLPPRPDSFINTSPEGSRLANSPVSFQESTRSNNSPSPSREVTRLSPTSVPSNSVSPVPPVIRRVNGLPPRPDSFVELRDSQSADIARSMPRTMPTSSSELRTSTLQRSASSVSASRSSELRTSALQRSASSVSRSPSSAASVELRTTTLQRSMSSASRTTSVRKSPVHLSPVDERPSEFPRSVSLHDPPSRTSVAERSFETDEPPSSRPLPRKRDSFVLQRARAFENNEESEQILSKFPLPPKPPVSTLPTRLSSHRRRLSGGQPSS